MTFIPHCFVWFSEEKFSSEVHLQASRHIYLWKLANFLESFWFECSVSRTDKKDILLPQPVERAFTVQEERFKLGKSLGHVWSLTYVDVPGSCKTSLLQRTGTKIAPPNSLCRSWGVQSRANKTFSIVQLNPFFFFFFFCVKPHLYKVYMQLYEVWLLYWVGVLFSL